MSKYGQNETITQWLLEQMETMGYYRYARPNQVKRLKTMFLKAPTLWNKRVKRDYPADEERLAECGAGDFLKDITPIFELSGVNLGQIKEECGAGKGYWMTLNGTRYELYSAEDVRAANEDKKSIVMWENATRRSFALINKLFLDSGSDERIYSFDGWNDHWAFILTEALHDVLCQSGLIDAANQLVLYDPSELIR